MHTGFAFHWRFNSFKSVFIGQSENHKSRLKEISKLKYQLYYYRSNGMKISEWKNIICRNNFESHILAADVLILYNSHGMSNEQCNIVLLFFNGWLSKILSHRSNAAIKVLRNKVNKCVANLCIQYWWWMANATQKSHKF